MGSDGESDQASGTSSDEVQSPTGVCLRNRGNRRISAEVRISSVTLDSFMAVLPFFKWGLVGNMTHCNLHYNMYSLARTWLLNTCFDQ